MLLCEQNFRDFWSRNESVRAEICQILHTDTHTHTHTHAAKLVVEICLEVQSSIHIQLQSYWTSKFGKMIPYAIFTQKRALPCVTKISLTEKLFGVGSSNFGFVHLDNWATH